jgi:hypothetical protein
VFEWAIVPEILNHNLARAPTLDRDWGRLTVNDERTMYHAGMMDDERTLNDWQIVDDERVLVNDGRMVIDGSTVPEEKVVRDGGTQVK